MRLSLLTSFLPRNGRDRGLLTGALILIAGSVVMMVSHGWPSSAGVPSQASLLAPFSVLGTMAATETQKLSGPSGSVVIWKFQDLQQTPRPLQTLQQAYDERMAQSPALHIVARGEDRVDIYGAINDPQVPTLTGSRFLELLNTYRDVDVLVLLGAVPTLTPGDYAKLPPNRPKVLVVDTLKVPDRRLFDEHVLQAALVRRVPPEPGDAPTPSDWANKCYVLMTPENTTAMAR